jgi:phenylalanyl-tRNA synthetase alpha chain
MKQFAELWELAATEILKATTVAEVEQLKLRYSGKSGVITALLQQLKHLEPQQKKEFGAAVNQLKNAFEQKLNAQRHGILEAELQQRLAHESIDVSLAARGLPRGSLHPVNLALQRLIAIFNQLGFALTDGPEIETDYYNFQALNIPDYHPARAMQDTFYTVGGNVLRTHTSPLQVRYAEVRQPPIKVIAPGRVYRVDMDATHAPMFHQMELLWIDQGISFANFKAIIIEFMRKFFAVSDLEVRFRASFFPFTEPSAEVDIYFTKTQQWLEVGGCGMVHPKVLQQMKIDAQRFRGFAFGVGVDRLAMLKYGITDLRLMFENDLDFLQQFKGL